MHTHRKYEETTKAQGPLLVLMTQDPKLGERQEALTLFVGGDLLLDGGLTPGCPRLLEVVFIRLPFLVFKLLLDKAGRNQFW